MVLLSLTPREWNVLVELCQDGPSNRVLGARLFIAEHTVKSHVKAILLKGRFASRTELVVAVLRGRVALACNVPQKSIPPALTWNDTVNGRPRN